MTRSFVKFLTLAFIPWATADGGPGLGMRASSIIGQWDYAAASRADGPAAADYCPIDDDLFAQFQTGDEDAMAEIVARFHKRLVGYLKLYCRTLELAEEVAQEAFLAAYHQRREIYGPAQVRPWIYTVARRGAMRELQRKRYELEITLEHDVLDAASPGVAGRQTHGILDEQSRRWIESALKVLSPVERDLITLRFFGELSIKELSATLDMPMGTVGVKMGRALEKARKELERQGVSPEDLLA